MFLLREAGTRGAQKAAQCGARLSNKFFLYEKLRDKQKNKNKPPNIQKQVTQPYIFNVFVARGGHTRGTRGGAMWRGTVNKSYKTHGFVHFVKIDQQICHPGRTIRKADDYNKLIWARTIQIE